MIDTIHIELPFENLEGLVQKSDTIDGITGEVLFSTGHLDYIKIRKYKSVMKIECSLPKLLKGNNIYYLNYHMFVEAIELIEGKLGISLREGIIRRLDVGFGVETFLEPKDYFRYFGSCKYYLRLPVGRTSLYYKNKCREKYFYDKIKELKSKGKTIPKSFIGKKILKFECRYKNTYLKKLARKFGCRGNVFCVSDLIDKNIYKQFAKEVMIEYNQIDKINKTVLNRMPINSKADFLGQLACKGIEAMGGVNNVIEMIEASRIMYSDTPKEYFSRRKKEARLLSQLPGITVETDLIRELDLKINLNYDKQIKILDNEKK